MFAVNHHSFIHSTNSYIIINFTYLCKVVELPVWLKIIKIAIVYSARHCTKYLPNKIIFFFYNSPRRKNYYCQIPQMKHSWKMTSNPGDLSLPWSGWYLTKKMSEKPCINASETCYFPRYIFFFSGNFLFWKNLTYWDVETWHWGLKKQNSFSTLCQELQHISYLIKTKT